MNQRDMKVERVNKMIDELGYDDWDEFISGVVIEGGTVALEYVEARASAIAVRAAEIAEYCQWRGSAGLGDHGHNEAMKAVAVQRKKVRKAMDYSYP